VHFKNARYPLCSLLIASPERAISFLKRRLRSVPEPNAEHVERLIADLDSDQANRREAALKDLAQLGTLVEPALRIARSLPTAARGRRPFLGHRPAQPAPACRSSARCGLRSARRPMAHAPGLGSFPTLTAHNDPLVVHE
jgi:hypothetical protein